jgi:hypothetical protein
VVPEEGRRDRPGLRGRPAEALAAIKEAVTLRRQLAAAEPNTITDGLAASLNNLSIQLATRC